MVIFARKKLHLMQTVRQTQAFSEGFGDIKLDLKNKSNCLFPLPENLFGYRR